MSVASPDNPLPLERGGLLKHAHLAYERFGSDQPEQTVLICHALTGDAHVARHDRHDPSERRGWWETLIGPGRAIDTDTTAVFCSNVLGGCAGSTGPASVNPETGARFGPDFPAITIADMVAAQRRLLDTLGIEGQFFVIGGSIGGFQALEWLRSYPERLAGAAIIGAGTGLGSYGLAHNEVARGAIRADARFQGGRYHPEHPPAGGLAAARQLAHLTYRTADAFERRFGRRTDGDRFNVASYLSHKGNSFVNRFDANAYLVLLDAMDRFDATHDRGLQTGLARFRGRLLIAGFTTDLLFPPSQSHDVARIANDAGAEHRLEIIETAEGHDAFLMPSPALESAVASLLASGVDA
ncbi:MAG: homoserine O-acetyltransferase [Planctomycetota bacterium]